MRRGRDGLRVSRNRINRIFHLSISLVGPVALCGHKIYKRNSEICNPGSDKYVHDGWKRSLVATQI